MILHPFIKNIADNMPPYFGTGTAVACGISLRRNIAGYPFPQEASNNLLKSIQELVCATFQSDEIKGTLPRFFEVPAKDLTDTDKELLCERDLISTPIPEERCGTHLFCAEDGSFSALVNGQDHLELRLISPDCDLESLRDEMEHIDNLLSKKIRYMYHNEYGYLTASPIHAGTGLHVWTVVHLPALTLASRVKDLLEQVEGMGLEAEAFYPIKKNAAGNLYRLTNVSTMGEGEYEIVQRVCNATQRLIQEEERTRNDIIIRQTPAFLNACGRSFGLLKYSYMLPTAEMLDALSILKLGTDTGVFRHFREEDWASMAIKGLPAHLVCQNNGELTPIEAGEIRAKMLRELLNGSKPQAGFKPA